MTAEADPIISSKMLIFIGNSPFPPFPRPIPSKAAPLDKPDSPYKPRYAVLNGVPYCNKELKRCAASY
ncbi:MAG: hypothetical protein KGK16_12495 [Bradyrhizobium sp.]|nr:hypothetical protein [Bradyrhizobium sp.]